MFMIFLFFSVIVFASFLDRFREVFWLVFGSTFGAFGGQEAAKMSSTIDAKIGIEKRRFWGGPVRRNLSLAGARRGVMGGGG